ncbi:MAG: site-specific recombinase [Aquabacterium sp.]|nr:site-specific recombinase [Aquabacterium sp.]
MLSPPDLYFLLDRIDPDADLAHRHLWLMSLMRWIRGDETSVDAAIGRVDLLLDVLKARPHTTDQLRAWWLRLSDTVDGSVLMSDYGFASRSAFVSELTDRLHRKFLPATPETVDACELFPQVLNSEFDPQWLTALSVASLARLAQLLGLRSRVGAASGITYWQYTLMEAITFCTSQIRAFGFSPEVRLRMSPTAHEASPFHTLASVWDEVRDACLAGRDVSPVALHFETQLDQCCLAASSVYTHLDEHGISVDLVFRLRQFSKRVARIRTLMDCLLDDPNHQHTARLLAHLAVVGKTQGSIRDLIDANASLLAAKVAERNAETGEHYITRNWAEYKAMLRQSAGGGGIIALTTALKFSVMALGLSAFWYGFWAGVVYAASFVLIQLLHYTVATKQPAMTAPAMAAKLKNISAPDAVDHFVDEFTHLVRSQVAAVFGNVAMVFPLTAAISMIWSLVFGRSFITPATADYVLHSITLLGPSALFAAFTGVLLFSSSIFAGWVENWFVLHRVDSALRYNPKVTSWLGVARADWAASFFRDNISGFAANISLGLMLGLVPSVFGFLGVGLDVRHVTLSAGQLGMACATLGWDVVYEPSLWWAVACLPVMGALNVLVSFGLAFRVALRAHNVSQVDRRVINQAILKRFRCEPLRFVWPSREG